MAISQLTIITIINMVDKYLDSPASFDESDAVCIVLFDASCDGENVGIKDDIVRVKSDFVNQYVVGSDTYFYFPISISRLNRKRCRHLIYGEL